MAANKWPRTMTSGVLSGQTFADHAEYSRALRAAKNGPAEASAEGDSAPAPARRARARKAGKAGGVVTRKMAEGVTAAANLFLYLIPATREDTFNETESEALTRSILSQAESNRFFANIIVRLAGAGTAGQLGVCVGALATVRLVKHNKLPLMAGIMAEAAINAIATGDVTELEPAMPQPEPSPNGATEYAGAMAG